MDVWSFGLVNMEMATGERPVVCQIRNQIARVISEKLRELISSYTHINPVERPPMEWVVDFLNKLRVAVAEKRYEINVNSTGSWSFSQLVRALHR